MNALLNTPTDSATALLSANTKAGIDAPAATPQAGVPNDFAQILGKIDGQLIFNQPNTAEANRAAQLELPREPVLPSYTPQALPYSSGVRVDSELQLERAASRLYRTATLVPIAELPTHIHG